MKDQFVTYEIALKLKELSFNEISRFGNETSLYNKEGKHVFYCNYGFMGSGLSNGYIYAPLWQQAISFLNKYLLKCGYENYSNVYIFEDFIAIGQLELNILEAIEKIKQTS